MKFKKNISNKRNAIFFIGLVILGMFFVTNCSTMTGLQRSKETSVSLQVLDNDIKLIIVQLDSIGASLFELTKAGQADIKKAFDLYSKNIENIEKLEKDYRKHSEELKAQGKNYFSEWKREGGKYRNSDIQDLSDGRRAELGAIYDDIAKNSVGVNDSFRTFVIDSKEIHTYLSNDLTKRGVETISPISNRVQQDAFNLRNAVRKTQGSIEKARAQMLQQGN